MSMPQQDKQPKKRGRKRKKENQYFTKFHEQQIIKYNNTEDINVRSRIYKQDIKPVFSEMVDKIVYTYRFTTLPNIDSLREECKVWLVTILEKFQPEKGHKAFSYFSVITKNWFIHETKKHKKRLKKHIVIEDIYEVKDQLIVENQYHQKRETSEFMFLLEKEIQEWKKMDLKEQEEQLVKAIEIIFRDIDSIPIFNKKAIYLYLREITGMNTKQLTSSLTKIRRRYKDFKQRWDNGEL